MKIAFVPESWFSMQVFFLSQIKSGPMATHLANIVTIMLLLFIQAQF